jgi:hypothetical protein
MLLAVTREGAALALGATSRGLPTRCRGSSEGLRSSLPWAAATCGSVAAEDRPTA